jgi:hypothetical protein
MFRAVADDLVSYAGSKNAKAIRDLGLWLHDAGGVDAMNAAFDLALRRHGYASLQGVNAAWKEIGNWDD